MNKNIKKFVFAALISSFAFTGCEKFLDINDNPNKPDKADPSLLLPTVEAALSQVVGNQLQSYGGLWAQYWTQNPAASQYQSIEEYSMKGTDADRLWSNIYRSALINAEIIINTEGASHNYYKGIAYLLKAYTFQVATDAFGDIPLDEALQGGVVRNPKYQSQQEVYEHIFASIDKGMELLNGATGAIPGKQDMFFEGNLDSWKAFGNTLKLKAYLRISKVDAAKSQAGIEALYAASPTFLEEDVSIAYTATGGNENPFYNEMVGLRYVQNPVASATAVQAFVANNDERQFKLYDRLSGQDTIAYLVQGDYKGQNKKNVSTPSSLVGAKALDPNSAKAPVKIFSKTESLFLQAEAIAKGWGKGDAKEKYEAGIKASFEALGLDGTTYLASKAADVEFPTDKAEQLKTIITQKYYALNGFQNFEAWTEWRRTGYPDFLTVSKASIIGGNQMPKRLIYPNTELTSNLNYPGTEAITKPVWWDVNK